MGSTLLIALAIGALTTLLALGFAYAIRFKCGRFGDAVAVPDADHPIRRISGEDLCLEEHPRPRGHPQPVPPVDGTDRRAARRPALQRQRRRDHPDLFPAALRHPADLWQSARHPPTPRSKRRATSAPALGGAARHRHAAMRERHRHRLPVRLPHHGRRLRDAALRRRRRVDDGPFHRTAILFRLQLADGQRHVLHAAWPCRWPLVMLFRGAVAAGLQP